MAVDLLRHVSFLHCRIAPCPKASDIKAASRYIDVKQRGLGWGRALHCIRHYIFSRYFVGGIRERKKKGD
jgi:hypothetical protein